MHAALQETFSSRSYIWSYFVRKFCVNLTFAFPLQQWLHERDSLLRWYVHCLSCFTVTEDGVLLEATVDWILFNSRQLYSMFLSIMLMIRNTTCFAHTLKLLNVYSWRKEVLQIKLRGFKTVCCLPWVNCLFVRQEIISLHLRFIIYLWTWCSWIRAS